MHLALSSTTHDATCALSRGAEPLAVGALASVVEYVALLCMHTGRISAADSGSDALICVLQWRAYVHCTSAKPA